MKILKKAKKNRPIVIITMIDDVVSNNISFPIHIPYYFWKVNRYQSLAKYLVSLAVDFIPKQIWIITNPNIIPAMKEHIGELGIYRFISPKRKRIKAEDRYIPVYYWSHPEHLKSIGKREKTFQQIFLAKKLNKFYNKIMYSNRVNKFLFLDSAVFFEEAFIGKLKKQVRDCKNHLFKFSFKSTNMSYLTAQVPVVLDIEQINLIYKFYETIKTMDKKIIKHEEIVACLSEEKFDSKSEIGLLHRFYSFKKFSSYANFVRNAIERGRPIITNKFLKEKNITYSHIFSIRRGKNSHSFLVTKPIEENVIYPNLEKKKQETIR